MGEVSVKPLEWKLADDNWWGASALGLNYEVRLARASVRVRFPSYSRFVGFDGTIDEAKSAAQADYEQRVRAVLGPDAATHEEVEQLREAAKALIDDVRRRHPGEDLHCPFMRELDAALRQGGGDG